MLRTRPRASLVLSLGEKTLGLEEGEWGEGEEEGREEERVWEGGRIEDRGGEEKTLEEGRRGRWEAGAEGARVPGGHSGQGDT